MKIKRIILVLLCLSVVFSLTACKYRLKEPYYEVGEIDGVTLETVGEITSTDGTFVIKNKSDQTAEYGNWYALEIYKNGKWKRMVSRNGPDFPLDAAILEAGRNSHELAEKWKREYGKLKPGKYRYVKSVHCSEKSGVYYIACEFEIK